MKFPCYCLRFGTNRKTVPSFSEKTLTTFLLLVLCFSTENAVISPVLRIARSLYVNVKTLSKEKQYIKGSRERVLKSQI